jgi:hypothetical protein
VASVNLEFRTVSLMWMGRNSADGKVNRGSNHVGGEISAPIYTGSGSHPTFCTMGTESHFREYSRPGVALVTHLNPVPRLKKRFFYVRMTVHRNRLKWIKPTDALNSTFISMTNLHVSGSLSAHHQGFLAVYRLWYILCSCDEPYATRSSLNALTGYFTPSHVKHQRLLLQFLSAPEDGRT